MASPIINELYRNNIIVLPIVFLIVLPIVFLEIDRMIL